jgi:hypothetical protein
MIYVEDVDAPRVVVGHPADPVLAAFSTIFSGAGSFQGLAGNGGRGAAA